MGLSPPAPPEGAVAAFTIHRVAEPLPGLAVQACAVVRESITRCCAADHGDDPAVLGAWLANKTPAQFTAWLSAPGAMAWAAYRGEGVDADAGVHAPMVGFALLLPPATLALCYAVPAVLYQGVGRALLQAAEAGARQCGAPVLALDSTRTAQGFYRRNGYAPAGAAKAWAGLWAQPLSKRL
ncbi:MAG: GNAT family N-acetyltransferase [Acidovorax sp.]|uniref:GNAT family N-acetyltransferase n=1 Tax=Acidovorax sp. TaxID=1872122 RepID=UPI0025C1965B|nr:GNAT family N-acetyltransferase [Acidovorax sp.]MCE1191685.1 GNAT family N-acetyltransferase [Acidovorax sp.]